MPRQIRVDGEPEIQEKEKMLLNIVLDESGSMYDNRQATISGFNEYLDSLKRETTFEVFVNFIKFNTDSGSLKDTPKITKLMLGERLSKVPRLSQENYFPSGGTPLYDAVDEAIEDAGKFVNGKPGEHFKVLFIVITDGEENSSKKSTSEKVKALITERQTNKDYGWTFVYLGANQDAWATSRAMGISGSNTSTWTSSSVGTSFAMRSLAKDTVAYLHSSSVGSSYDGFTQSSYDINKKVAPVVAEEEEETK